VRRIAAIGEWRGALGHNAGVLWICARMSGDAFTTANLPVIGAALDVTAIESCVRGT
jgi:hypothetical protein